MLMLKISALSLIFILIFTPNKNRNIDEVLLIEFAKNKNVNCLIHFESQNKNINSSHLKTKEEKGVYIYDILKNNSVHAQKDVQFYLKEKSIKYKSFFIVNAIAASLTQIQAEQISRLNHVKKIVFDPAVKMEMPKQHNTSITLKNQEPEWGIRQIMADSVWTLGWKGEDVVIGGQDTGYDWDHSVLKNKYRGYDGNTVDHNYNWHDAIDTLLQGGTNPCGLSLTEPCDDNNHGTHTMGTMVGSDENNALGVAPNAKWVACRNMERGVGRPSTYIECFEWFLAPTDLNGENPRPDLAPDIINNSWSCPENEGCNESNWAIMEDVVIALKAAGIFVAVSAGNTGRDGCGSVDRAPAFFDSSFSVGATNGLDEITNFSSIGPVTIDSSLRLKPEITAPGFGVRSSINNDQFREFSGTSMASPHVAGTVALILSAEPSLRGQVEDLELILKLSTQPLFSDIDCGYVPNTTSGIPNIRFGFGRLNALNAIIVAQQTTSTSEQIEHSDELVVYPNPVMDILYFKNEYLKDQMKSISIFDLNGRNIYKSETEENFINLLSVPKGIYFINIKSGNQSYIKKFVKFRQ